MRYIILVAESKASVGWYLHTPALSFAVWDGASKAAMDPLITASVGQALHTLVTEHQVESILESGATGLMDWRTVIQKANLSGAQSARLCFLPDIYDHRTYMCFTCDMCASLWERQERLHLQRSKLMLLKMEDVKILVSWSLTRMF